MCDYNKVFREIAQYRNIKAQAEAELARLENEIKSFMEESKLDELLGDEHKATYKEVKTNRVDTTKLKREMPDIAAQYTKECSSMRFNFV